MRNRCSEWAWECNRLSLHMLEAMSDIKDDPRILRARTAKTNKARTAKAEKDTLDSECALLDFRNRHKLKHR